MTLKIQRSYRIRHRGNEVVLVVKIKMADTLLVLRVKPTAGTRRNKSKKYSKNRKKTTRRATSAIWGIFVKLNKPKRTLSKMN